MDEQWTWVDWGSAVGYGSRPASAASSLGRGPRVSSNKSSVGGMLKSGLNMFTNKASAPALHPDRMARISRYGGEVVGNTSAPFRECCW